MPVASHSHLHQVPTGRQLDEVSTGIFMFDNYVVSVVVLCRARRSYVFVCHVTFGDSFIVDLDSSI